MLLPLHFQEHAHPTAHTHSHNYLLYAHHCPLSREPPRSFGIISRIHRQNSHTLTPAFPLAASQRLRLRLVASIMDLAIPQAPATL